jgi:hypothetical protein
MNAVADLGRRVRNLLRPQAAVHRPPRLGVVVAAEHAGGGDRDEEPSGMDGIEDDRMQAHPAGARLPGLRRLVRAQPGQLLPGLPAVARFEQRGVLDASVDRVGIDCGRLQMPHASELPRVRRAVVPEMCACRAVVDEFVADGLPRLAAVVRTLDQLAEPAAGLGSIKPIRVGGRALEVIHLPAPEMWTAHVPALTLAVRRQNERALARTNQHSYPAHRRLPPASTIDFRSASPRSKLPPIIMSISTDRWTIFAMKFA